MMAGPKLLDAVPVGRIFLLQSNPRHEPVDSEAKAIAYLCTKEAVLPLARDIQKIGLNPLERFALISAGKSGRTDAFYSAEGNRRICALKLLNDPELAPANFRKQFEKLSAKWQPIKTVQAAVFGNLDEARVWLDRIHNGYQGGVGRKDWNAEQKSRFDGENKNRSAQALLDYATAEGMITEQERARKLTTVQRFVSNDVFREMAGLDQDDPEALRRTRPKAAFDVIIKKFMRDLVGGKNVSSRMNKEAIIKYARPLSALAGVTNERVQSESLDSDSDEAKPAKKKKKSKPSKPAKAALVQYDPDIADALKGLKNEKLISLYHSICTVELEDHTPLVSIGAWAFLETLTACAGRNDSVSFEAFLSKGKLGLYGIKGDTVALRSAISRTCHYGNTTKHHPLSASFNGDQLNNDMVALREVLLKCIAEAAQSTP